MKDYSRRTVAYYDSISDVYISSDAAVVVRDKIDVFAGLLPGKRVLDVGCGPGHDSDHLSEMGFDCLGVDLSGGMIEIAQEKSKGRFEVMDVLDLRLEEDSFDGMWCSSIFVHIRKRDISKFLQSSRRILRDRGIIGIITPKQQKRVKMAEDTREYVMYRKSELECILKKAGFRILISEVFPYGGKDRIYIIAEKSSINSFDERS